MTSTSLHPTEREEIARRLLISSAKASFDPLTEIDWDAPVDMDRYAMPPQRLSLYGTGLWDQLTAEQRKELSRQEVACIASVGIWFEAILMQMLIRYAYDRDPGSSHIQYSYTEIGDECRHTIMFARMISKLGATYYRPDPLARFLGRALKTFSSGPLTFAATLFVEELLDQGQREIMRDESLEPLSRAVCRIHVTEEARHMRYAREELIRAWSAQPLLGRAVSRIALAIVAAISVDRLINPAAYARVGLDPKVARRVARRNPHRRASANWLARKAVETFTAAGLIKGPARLIWRRAGLYPRR
ncbi:MAG TPA: diiron oxygenase [Trebonia sp.]|nr:diiron oxygenase [Trebonia sp.]